MEMPLPILVEYNSETAPADVERFRVDIVDASLSVFITDKV
jgi:hypothetical protein